MAFKSSNYQNILVYPEGWDHLSRSLPFPAPVPAIHAVDFSDLDGALPHMAPGGCLYFLCTQDGFSMANTATRLASKCNVRMGFMRGENYPEQFRPLRRRDPLGDSDTDDGSPDASTEGADENQEAASGPADVDGDHGTTPEDWAQGESDGLGAEVPTDDAEDEGDPSQPDDDANSADEVDAEDVNTDGDVIGDGEVADAEQDADGAYVHVQRLPGRSDTLHVQFCRNGEAVSTEECALSALPLATQPAFTNAPDLHVVCGRRDEALIGAAQSLQHLAAVYFTFEDVAGNGLDFVPATEAFAGEPDPVTGTTRDAPAATAGSGSGPDDGAVKALRFSPHPADAIRYFNHRYFVASWGRNVVVVTVRVAPNTGYLRIVPMCEPDFRRKYANWLVDVDGKEVSAVTLWLRSPERRQYDEVVFAPGAAPVTDNCFNMFFGFPVVAVKGDCSLFWAHVRDNICGGNADRYAYVRKWMAHAIQMPGVRPGTALVLRGRQGVGKGVFVDLYSSLFGPYYLAVFRLTQVTGNFNGHLQNLLLVHVNEAVWDGDKKGAGVLKGLITDPEIPIEYKGLDIVRARNHLRFIIASNEDVPVPMDLDDRRYLLLDVSDVHQEDRAYFGALVEQFEHGGREALMFDLMQEDLDGFDPRFLPKGRAGFDIKIGLAPLVVQWWHECLRDGVNCREYASAVGFDWVPLVVKDALWREYDAWCRERRERTLPRPIFGRELHKMLRGTSFAEVRQKYARTPDGQREASRVYCYALPRLDECRRAFEAFSHSGPAIWSDTAEVEP